MIDIDAAGALLPLFVAAPLVAAGVLALLSRPLALRHAIAAGTLVALLLGALALLTATGDGTVIAHRVALWPNGIAIPFVADTFSALMLVATMLLAAVCFLYAIASGQAQDRYFPTFVLVLSAGVAGALLTGDLFNLFVFIEVMLLPSYGLLASTSRPAGIGGARLYVTVNLLASTIFLAGVALVYGTTGTVVIAQLAGAASESTVVAIATAACLSALAVKAAVVPVHGWLARSYPVASPVVTALFSGLHTKIAIYAIYRIYAVIFDGDSRYLWIALAITSLTMLIGVFGAMGERTMRSVLVFHMVSQIGYILVGVGLFTLYGLTAAIFYLLHHMIVKASLFLSTGAIEDHYGRGEISSLGGMRRREPVIAVAFMAAALSLSGIPPFSGFLAKFTLIAAVVEEGHLAVAVVAVVVSLLTILSMLKIWAGVFSGPVPSDLEEPANREVPASPPPTDGAAGLASSSAPTGSGDHGQTPVAVEASAGVVVRGRIPLRLAAPALVLAGVSLALGLGGEVLLALAAEAAAGLLDTALYVEAVIGG